MLEKSRFSVLYNNSDNSAKRFVTEKIGQYIDENPQYCDSKNYGHLCNLFSALAFETFFEQKCSRAEAIEKVKNAMYEYLEPTVLKMRRLSANPIFIPFLKLTMPLKFKCTCGFGWRIEYPKVDKNEFAMTTRECIFCKIFPNTVSLSLHRYSARLTIFCIPNCPVRIFCTQNNWVQAGVCATIGSVKNSVLKIPILQLYAKVKRSCLTNINIS